MTQGKVGGGDEAAREPGVSRTGQREADRPTSRKGGPVNDEQGYSHERELGRRLARLRDAAGLTQRELARRMDLTQSALSRIESGQRRL